MRSLLLLPLFLLAACSQNPHVDIASQPVTQNAGAAQSVPRSQAQPQPQPQAPGDRDHDGSIDTVDQCPDQPGPIENNGCPWPQWQDTDGDGTPDADDQCPTVAGPAELNGCPAPTNDRDHDFVPDDEDRCPDVPGQVFNDGCPLDQQPVLDRDHDGVPDSEDRCPDVAGQIYNDGCPLHERDTDGDGIGDSKDACPRVPGPACNRGCPFPREEERRVLLDVKDSLKFDFDRATIKASSLPALDRLVGFLRRYPDAQIRMVGHTDDQGTDEYNMRLSEARVTAVKDYLVSRGVTERNVVTGFRGERDPLVSIENLEGERLEAARAKNRRVDMSVKYETSVPGRGGSCSGTGGSYGGHAGNGYGSAPTHGNGGSYGGSSTPAPTPSYGGPRGGHY